MALHLQRNLVFSGVLLLMLLQCQRITATEDTPTANNGDGADEDDDDDSSSEETAEDSNEPAQRRKRALPDSKQETSASAPETRAAIPGLPDPATIIKIAEIIQTVGNKVLPLLTQGTSTLIANLNADERAAIEAGDASDDDGDAAVESQRHFDNKDFQFLRMFKRRIDNFITAHRATII